MFYPSYRTKLTATFIAFAAFILILLVWFLFAMLQKKQFDNAIESAQKIHEEKIKFFENYVKQVDDTLLALKESRTLQVYLQEPKIENLQKLDELMLTLSDANSNIMQMRYLSSSGEEIVRVNRDSRDSSPYLVKKKSLKNKKECKYVESLLSANDKKIWYSRIDLNTEDAHITYPLTPLLRVGIALYKEGKREGVLMIHIFMRDFLQSFISSSSYDIYLVDSDGYILVSPEYRDDFGRYLKRGTLFSEVEHNDRFYTNSIAFYKSGNLKLYYVPKKAAIYTLLEEEQREILLVMLLIIVLSIPLAYLFARYPSMLEKKLNEYNSSLQERIEYIQKQEERLLSIINAADDLIFFKDLEGVYLGCNRAYEKWRAREKEDIIGRRDRDFYPKDIAQANTLIDEQVIKENRTVVIEQDFLKDDGSMSTLQVKKSPFHDLKARAIGVVVVARDVTHLKEMEQELRTLNTSLERRVYEKTQELQKFNDKLEQSVVELNRLNIKLLSAKEEAMQAAQAKSNFISTISHELRTPLNSIINFTDQVLEDFDEMLEDRELQEETQMFLGRVMVNSRHLLELINDLLEFTKAEAGKMEYSMEEVDINSILLSAYNNTHSLLSASEVDFRFAPSTQRLLAKVDVRRFLQVLLNLLSNAIKFTNRGHIILRSFAQEHHIVVEIEDTGKGIPLDRQESIFEPFIQVNSTDAGTGLGLGLAKKMCDDMGVEITLYSVERKGTIFKLLIEREFLS